MGATVRALRVALVGTVVLTGATGCADQDITRDVEARWCELVGADCAPPPPLQPPVLNHPHDGYRPAGPGFVIPPVDTPSAQRADTQ